MNPLAPTLLAERCLNAVNQMAGCLRCATACPAPGAIRLLGGLPVLDEAACARCGVCLHVCPTDAYDGPDWPEEGLARAVAAAPVAAVALVCHLHPTPGETTTSAAAVVQAKRCLASLSPARLLALADGRDLWLDDSPCAGCEIGAAAATLAQSAAMAEALRSAGQRPGSVRLTSAASPAPRRRANVLDAGSPPVTRRALVTGLVTRVRATLEAPAAVARSPVARAGRQLPAERRRLLDALAGWSSTLDSAREVSGPDLATVRVDDRTCSACGVCDRACPTGALRFEATDGAFQLDLVAAACVACHVCVNMCPEDAVRLVSAVEVDDLTTPRRRSLARGDLTTCASCGADVARRDDIETAICHSCRATGGPTRHGRDTASLMDDLLRRARRLPKGSD